MPTGYTLWILDGKIATFPQFAKLCMRAFGATIHMRDDELGAEYEPRVSSDYYAKNIETAKLALYAAQNLTDDEIIFNRKVQLKQDKEYHKKSIDKAKADAEKLSEILKDVRLWQPPTKDHEEIKSFMIEQIEKTLEFDCNAKYNDEALIKIELELLTINAKTIREEMISKAKKDIEYYTRQHNDEVKRCEDSNKWVSDFIDSLKQKVE